MTIQEYQKQIKQLNDKMQTFKNKAISAHKQFKSYRGKPKFDEKSKADKLMIAKMRTSHKINANEKDGIEAQFLNEQTEAAKRMIEKMSTLSHINEVEKLAKEALSLTANDFNKKEKFYTNIINQKTGIIKDLNNELKNQKNILENHAYLPTDEEHLNERFITVMGKIQNIATTSPSTAFQDQTLKRLSKQQTLAGQAAKNLLNQVEKELVKVTGHNRQHILLQNIDILELAYEDHQTRFKNFDEALKTYDKQQNDLGEAEKYLEKSITNLQAFAHSHPQYQNQIDNVIQKTKNTISNFSQSNLETSDLTQLSELTQLIDTQSGAINQFYDDIEIKITKEIQQGTNKIKDLLSEQSGLVTQLNSTIKNNETLLVQDSAKKFSQQINEVEGKRQGLLIEAEKTTSSQQLLDMLERIEKLSANINTIERNVFSDIKIRLEEKKERFKKDMEKYPELINNLENITIPDIQPGTTATVSKQQSIIADINNSLDNTYNQFIKAKQIDNLVGSILNENIPKKDLVNYLNLSNPGEILKKASIQNHQQLRKNLNKLELRELEKEILEVISQYLPQKEKQINFLLWTIDAEQPKLKDYVDNAETVEAALCLKDTAHTTADNIKAVIDNEQEKTVNQLKNIENVNLKEIFSPNKNSINTLQAIEHIFKIEENFDDQFKSQNVLKKEFVNQSIKNIAKDASLATAINVITGHKDLFNPIFILALQHQLDNDNVNVASKKLKSLLLKEDSADIMGILFKNENEYLETVSQNQKISINRPGAVFANLEKWFEPLSDFSDDDLKSIKKMMHEIDKIDNKVEIFHQLRNYPHGELTALSTAYNQINQFFEKKIGGNSGHKPLLQKTKIECLTALVSQKDYLAGLNKAEQVMNKNFKESFGQKINSLWMDFKKLFANLKENAQSLLQSKSKTEPVASKPANPKTTKKKLQQDFKTTLNKLKNTNKDSDDQLSNKNNGYSST